MWEALGGSVLSAGCGTSFSEEPLLGFGSGNILLVGCLDIVGGWSMCPLVWW